MLLLWVADEVDEKHWLVGGWLLLLHLVAEREHAVDLTALDIDLHHRVVFL